MAFPGFFRGQPEPPVRVALAQFGKTFPALKGDRIPVVEAGASQVLVIDGKAELADQVQPGAGRRAQPGNVAGVGRDLRFDQDNMQVRRSHGCG